MEFYQSEWRFRLMRCRRCGVFVIPTRKPRERYEYGWHSAYHRLILDPNLYVIVFGVTVGYFAVCGITSLYRRMETRAEFSRTAWILSPTLYAFMLIVVILWSSGKTVFVYFQF
jgi:hypothetical protein